MFYDLDDASLVNVWTWMRFVAADDEVELLIEEFSARAGILELPVTQVLEQGHQVIPLEVGWSGRCKQLGQMLFMLGHPVPTPIPKV
jgi:hypothetical protein